MAQINRMEPIAFRLFGQFNEVVDRSTSDYTPGFYFNFLTAGTSFDVPVDKQQFDNPSEEGADVWVVGALPTNERGQPQFKRMRFVEPSDNMPPQSPDEAVNGGEFRGIGMFRKTSYPRKADGGTGYKTTLLGLGFQYDFFPEFDVYDMYPGDKLGVVSGRVVPELRQNEKGQKRTFYRLVFNDYKIPRPTGQAPEAKENKKA